MGQLFPCLASGQKAWGGGEWGEGRVGRIGGGDSGEDRLFCSLPAKCACVIGTEETSKAEEHLQFQALEYPVAATKIYSVWMK